MLMKRWAARGGAIAPAAPLDVLRGALIRVSGAHRLTRSCSTPARVSHANVSVSESQGRQDTPGGEAEGGGSNIDIIPQRHARLSARL